MTICSVRIRWRGQIGFRKEMGLARKITVGSTLLILGAAVVIIGPGLVLGVLLSFGGTRTIFERAPSPDGRHEARVQFDDGGAISSFDRIVFVKSRWNPADQPLLSCRAFWAEGEAEVHLRWLDNHTLQIEHAFPARDITDVTPRCGDIKIVTKPMAASP